MTITVLAIRKSYLYIDGYDRIVAAAVDAIFIPAATKESSVHLEAMGNWSSFVISLPRLETVFHKQQSSCKNNQIVHNFAQLRSPTSGTFDVPQFGRRAFSIASYATWNDPFSRSYNN